MATVKIKEYDVKFPYETPYDIQKVYMEKVITCLNEGKHGVLESPTGTGKTLCLFAPVATWMRSQKEKLKTQAYTHMPMEDQKRFFDEVQEKLENGLIPPSSDSWEKKSRVWYTSRTHSQIAQSVSEIRKCDIEGLKIRVMGARDQLCINPEVASEKESYVKTIKCKELVKERKCRFYQKTNYEKFGKEFYQDGEVLDIEDLVTVGRKNCVCPYYMSKDASNNADIVLLPYNYIIDKDAREGNNFQFNEDIIIFDEGHNVPSTCEESYEFQLTSVDLALGAEHVRQLMEHLFRVIEHNLTKDEEEENFVHTHSNYAQLLMKILLKLQAGLEKIRTSSELLSLSVLHDFFREANVTDDSSRGILEAIESFKNNATQLNLPGNVLSVFYLLEKIVGIMFGPVVKLFDTKTIDQSFKVSITMEENRAAKSKKVSLYCFNPSFGIKTLLQLGAKSIIITSGTLSPLHTFIHELSLPEPVTVENGHIAKKCQVPFVILGTGVNNNERMDGSFKNRNKPEYVFSLGNTLTNLVSSIPDGVLLLFSSYSMMNSLKDSWESNHGIWTRLNNIKRVFIEPRGKEEFITCMENYKRAIDSGNGAILMGVLRGKISEGMDFKDQYCRGVFIIGVPFPPVQDPRVKGKEKYAESLTYTNPKTNRIEKLYNNSFLSVEAMKATNQAIGRVIRHGQDYGAIILVDYRFTSPRLFFNISSWLRGGKPGEKNFTETKRLLREFFKDVHTGKLGITEVRRQRVDSNGCPVAGYVSYEEFVYKKHVPAPNIAFAVEKKNKSGKAVIDYMDDDGDMKTNILSAYMSQSDNANSSAKALAKPSSLLDALEASRSSSVGYREIDPSDLLKENSETCKRKFMLDDDVKQEIVKSPRMDKKSLKLFSKITIQPLPPSEAQEPENVVLAVPNKTKTNSTDYLSSLPFNQPSNANNQPSSGNKKKLQEEIVKDYFKLVKDSIPDNYLYMRFAFAWAKYGKNECQLTDVTNTLKESISGATNKENLFRGFEVCVKNKDRGQWYQILKDNAF